MSRLRARPIALVAAVCAVGLTASSGAHAQEHPAPASSASTTSTWKQAGYLKASNPGDSDQFGYSVAISGDGGTLAVGAPMEASAATGVNGNQADNSMFSAGAVYVYVRAGGAWAQQAYVKASNPGENDQFGSAVALSADGNTLAVSAQFEDSAATGINGNQADNSMSESGAVYVFTRTGSTWWQQAYVKASNTGDPGEGDTFGYSIALSDDGSTLAVGAPSEDSASPGINGNQADNSMPGAGAVYVFARSGPTSLSRAASRLAEASGKGGNAWSQQAYVKSAKPSSSGAGGHLFGYSVGLSADGNNLAVGVYDEGGSSNVINGPVDDKLSGSGAVYVFARNGGTWSQEAYLKASTQDRGDSMGDWVAMSDDGSTVAAGALDEDTMSTGVNAVQAGNAALDMSAGAAYVFSRASRVWSQQASFKASNTGKEDWFGVRLALSGDGNTLAVSAPNEDSAAKGINGKQDDDSAQEAGAVYVFTRSGGLWTFHAYMKGSNTEQFDEFGSAVALSRDGRMMAVGARFEDSGAKGFGGNEADNSVSDSGAVYIFVR